MTASNDQIPGSQIFDRANLNHVFTEHNRTYVQCVPTSSTLGHWVDNGRRTKWLKAQREITGHQDDIATYRSIREREREGGGEGGSEREKEKGER